MCIQSSVSKKRPCPKTVLAVKVKIQQMFPGGGEGPLKTETIILEPHITNVVKPTMKQYGVDTRNSSNVMIVAILVINQDGALTNRNSAMLPFHLYLFSFYNRFSFLSNVCAECESSACLCSCDSLDTLSETDSTVKINSDILNLNNSFECSVSLCNNVHACSFQRPSEASDHIDVHALNASDDYYNHATSLQDTTISQHYHSNMSYDRSQVLSTFPNENLPSIPEAQQVSDSQIASNELSLPTSNTNISLESSQLACLIAEISPHYMIHLIWV